MDAVTCTNAHAWARLERAKRLLTSSQYRTLKGQIKAGDAAGAMHGLQRILARRENGGT